jgi:hypothetical protein
VFKAVTLRGATGAIVWGYRPAAVLRSWAIARTEAGGAWTLTARVETSDAYQLRQVPLVFTAPRKGGLWCWPVLPTSLSITPPHLRATLGPPEF